MARKALQTFDVFVGNLPSAASERNVGKIFTPYGEIAGIIVKETAKVQPPYNKFAFVKFLCEPDAEKAIKDLDKKNVQGSVIVVKRAEDRKKPFGEGGGRRGFKPSESDASSTDIASSVGGQDLESNTVMITHVETPITLWIQVVSDENTKKIFSITEQLGQLCPAAQPVTGQPETGKVYACLFSEDNMWYRCQVKQNIGTDKFSIQYIDYGNMEEVVLSSLVELPASMANVKGLAWKIQLHNTRAKDRSDKQGILFLKSLTENKMAKLVRTRALADGSGFYGDVFVDDYSLSDSMIQAGYCQGRSGTGKQHQVIRQAHNDTSLFSEMSGPQMIGSTFPEGMAKQHTLSPHVPPTLALSADQSRSGHTRMSNMRFPMQIIPSDHGREKKLQNQLTKKIQEIERMKNENDAANMQAEYMRSKVKTLQEEFAATSAALQEDTMSKRVNSVVALASAVRNLRKQFPTDNTPCLLEDTIAFCMDKDRVDNSKCQSLSDVCTSLARYKAAQDEISKCKEQTELQVLINTRDECRRDLHQSLSSCLEKLKRLPLETRSKQIQDIQCELMNTYAEYFKIQVHDVSSIENLAPGFNTWKAKKDAEFRDVRTATDFCEGILQTALNQVKERVRVQTTPKADESDVDLNDLFKKYCHALQMEMNVTDVVHGKDSSLVTTVIASVRKELQSEAATLQNISVLHQEFTSRKQTIEPWLNNSPTFADLQKKRKHIRSMKSKLRHIQADKLDLEESGDEGELDTIIEEEERIRSQLQAALTQADSLQREFATLADSNFPELILQCPDLEIELVYKGLVKSYREIDHYCLLSSFRPGVHISSFTGEPVMLQEFHVGDSGHCIKEEFMKQLIQYNGNTNMIQAVFFSKSDRLAYVQYPWDGGQLIECAVDDRQLTVEELHQVYLRLTEQVVDIHARGCIHGEIAPHNVILRDDNSVMLMCPDFSKNPNDRICTRHVTEGGLVFQTPELQYTSPEVLGQAADIYNLVLLIFWLNCPDHKPTTLSHDGTGHTNLSPTMQQLFDVVLSGKTATQVQAKQILGLLHESVPVQPVSVLESESVRVAPKPETVLASPVIKGTDEPMEIGVFQAEDYISEPDMLPLPPPTNANPTMDTDNSWTTENAVSGISRSREWSPLDTTLLEVQNMLESQKLDKCGVRSESSQTQISGNVQDKTLQTKNVSTNSSATLAIESKKVHEEISGVTEKGAACENADKSA